MKEYLLDANVLLRFLVQDDPKQSPAANVLLKKAERREVILHLEPLILLEAIFVLTGYYNRSRTEVANNLLALVRNSNIITRDLDTVVDALQRFAVFNVEYADAWLAARSSRLGHAVASFDHDYDKFKDVKRFEPTL